MPCPRNLRRSMLISAAGTSPKCVKTEKRPPTSGRALKTFRKPLRYARSCKDVLGSVTATKCLPTFPGSSFSSSAQKYLNADMVSLVPPLLLETINSDFARSTSCIRKAISSGLVVSIIRSFRPWLFCGAIAWLITSGASDDPPIPRTKAYW